MTSPTPTVLRFRVVCDPAEPEQTLRTAELVEVDLDELLRYSPDGRHRGTIFDCKPTKNECGLVVHVHHEDGASATAFYMLRREVDGRLQPDLGGQRAFALFCREVGVDPTEATRAAFAKQPSPLAGIERVWQFKTKGRYLNARHLGRAVVGRPDSGHVPPASVHEG